MPKFKIFLILLLPLFFATSCEEEWDLTDDQQVIEALLYQPVTSYNVIYKDTIFPVRLEPDVRALWVHTDSTLPHTECDHLVNYVHKDEYYILDLNTLRNELKVNKDKSITYKGMEVYAVEDVCHDSLAIFNRVGVKLKSAEDMPNLVRIANQLNCRLDTNLISCDAMLTTPLGIKAAYVSTYIKKNLQVYFIEVKHIINYKPM